MQVPPFPTSAPDNVFPYLEGVQWEFKETAPAPLKIRETVCAMLNAEGGHIVIGVKDNREICGIPPHGVDRFLLLTDKLHHYREITYEDDTPCGLGSFKARAVTLNNKQLVCITVCPEPGKKYKTHTGEMLCRLSASNYRIHTDRNYNKHEVERIRREAEEKLDEVVRGHKAIITEVNAANRRSSDAMQQVANITKQRDIAEGKAKTAECSVKILTSALFAKILAEKEAAEERMALEAIGCFKQMVGWASGILCGLGE